MNSNEQQWPTPPSEPVRPSTVPWHNPRADTLRSALREVADLRSLTATPAQFARHLQRVAERALTADAMCEPKDTPPAPPSEPEVPMVVVHECMDYDSPWLICKPCAAVGRCEQAAPQPLSDERIDKIARLIWPYPGNSLSMLRAFARAILAAAQKQKP
jgi:hypothetical protein